MSREYALSRVRDALEKSDGNHLKAQRLLLSWLEKDVSLLVGIVGPHVPSLVTHALTQVAAIDNPQTARVIEAGAEEAGEFGAALLDSLRGGRTDGDFGFGDSSSILSTPAPKPLKASQEHIDTIRKLAGGSGKKE